MGHVISTFPLFESVVKIDLECFIGASESGGLVTAAVNVS